MTWFLKQLNGAIHKAIVYKIYFYYKIWFGILCEPNEVTNWMALDSSDYLTELHICVPIKHNSIFEYVKFVTISYENDNVYLSVCRIFQNQSCKIRALNAPWLKNDLSNIRTILSRIFIKLLKAKLFIFNFFHFNVLLYTQCLALAFYKNWK